MGIIKNKRIFSETMEGFGKVNRVEVEYDLEPVREEARRLLGSGEHPIKVTAALRRQWPELDLAVAKKVVTELSEG